MATLHVMKKCSSPLQWLLVMVLSALMLPAAQAQWSWKDKEGGRVFSDQPPPPGVADKDILKRPPGSRSSASSTPPATAQATSSEATASALPSSPTATTPVLKVSGKDSELEKKKKEAETKEAAQKKADAEKVAANKKDNCDRARRAQASFDSGSRISIVNAQGEREIMSDSARAAETQRLKNIMASECN
jgi:Domain of unknown function (DUF4124)